MKIFPIDKKDASEIVAFESENFSDGWTLDMLNSAFETGRFFGFKIVEEDKILGVVTYSVTDDCSDLESIVVHRDYRKLGYGKLLIDRYFENAQKMGVKNFFLEVRKSNFPAISLYEQRGYKVINERKKYYADGENAFVLKKEIL